LKKLSFSEKHKKTQKKMKKSCARIRELPKIYSFFDINFDSLNKKITVSSNNTKISEKTPFFSEKKSSSYRLRKKRTFCCWAIIRDLFEKKNIKKSDSPIDL
jgi:hypothetical protein